MNLLAYLIPGFLVVMASGTYILFRAVRRAEDGFENEHGFQLGIAPSVQSLYSRPVLAPAAPARAVIPEATRRISSRRPSGSKPPMLPANLTLADLNPSTERNPRLPRKPAETQPPFPDSADTSNKQ
jgi:hypothetical protein